MRTISASAALAPGRIFILSRSGARMRTVVIQLALALVLAGSAATQESRAARKRPAREGHVDAGGGVRLFYRVAGAGSDTVIVLHGGPGFTSDYLDKDLDPLAQRYTLIFFDQRGTGRSTLVSDSAALDGQRFADDVDAVRRHFGLERVALFGHSWGASVAAMYAVRHPDRVTRILLLGAVPLRRAGLLAGIQALNARRDSAELRLLTTRRAERAANPSSADVCRAYYIVWFQPAFRDTAAARRSRGDFCYGSPAALANKAASVDRYTFPSLGEYDWRPAMRAVTAPTLVIQGPWEFMPLDFTREWIDALPNARLLLLEQGGHFAYLDSPVEFFAAADAFLSGRWPTRAVGRQP
jgi:proline iminopeptidase